MDIRRFFCVLMVCWFVIGFGCGLTYAREMEGGRMAYLRIEEVPQEVWGRVAEKRFLFGHQSVGFNILDGIRAVVREHPEIRLNIVETRDNGAFGRPVFAHARVGKNKQPATKIDDFVQLVVQPGVGDRLDGAALKLCYVDVIDGSNVKMIFDHYRQAMSKLQQRHLKLSLIYFTAPLTTAEMNWKWRVKAVLGKQDPNFADNISRQRFNDMMRAKYGPSGYLFDLAAIESTAPDGQRMTFSREGQTYEKLYPGYTNDGGHLNETGARLVGEQFLLFLANHFGR